MTTSKTQEKLSKIEALHKGAKTVGEKRAAGMRRDEFASKLGLNIGVGDEVLCWGETRGVVVARPDWQLSPNEVAVKESDGYVSIWQTWQLERVAAPAKQVAVESPCQCGKCRDRAARGVW